MGIDCSAFVQLCAKVAGFKLPRDASQQVNHGVTINFLSEARSGDIAFFENENRRITHVGILLSNDKIIHASGKVRIDTLDQTGIFNKETNRHTHVLSVIKRLKTND
jgi:cell wall-associated NlpC family hydrolase